MVIVEASRDGTVSRHEVPLYPASLALQASRVEELALDVLVCGAVSRVLADLLESSGLALVPWVAGDIDDVLGALDADELDSRRYMMPGCCRRRGRTRRRDRMEERIGRRSRRSP
jgi:hypothetical protein